MLHACRTTPGPAPRSRPPADRLLDEYIKAAGIGEDGKSTLFRSAVGRTGNLSAMAMNRIDAWRSYGLSV